jgi:hypothetical protein
MKSNNIHKINQIIDMLDSITERIDDIEKLLINRNSKVEDWTSVGLTEEENRIKKEWVCQVCKKSTFETDYDYIVHPKLCLGCALKEELKGKDIKEQYYEASSKLFKVGKRESVKYSSKGPEYDYRENPQLKSILNNRIESVEEPEGTPYTPEEIEAWNRASEDCGTQQPFDKYRKKLSEEIVDNKAKKYIYESPDSGKTIYRRKFGTNKKEFVKNWNKEKKINIQKN